MEFLQHLAASLKRGRTAELPAGIPSIHMDSNLNCGQLKMVLPCLVHFDSNVETLQCQFVYSRTNSSLEFITINLLI